MKAEYSRALKAFFEQALPQSAFGWQPTKVKSRYLFAGERAFNKAAAGELVFWCVLVGHERFDKFTLEIGWSRKGRFPELTMRPSLKRPAEAHEMSEYMVRLGQVSEGADVWWTVEEFQPPRSVEDLQQSLQPISAERARAVVEPVAQKALAMLETVGVPYLQSIDETSK